MRERLIEKLTETFDEQYEKRMLITPQHTADHLLADGWIRPPCKVMQTVYYISFGKVYEGICHAITIHDCSIQVHLYDYDGDNASYSAKDVYTSREQAEAKLKEGKG